MALSKGMRLIRAEAIAYYSAMAKELGVGMEWSRGVDTAHMTLIQEFEKMLRRTKTDRELESALDTIADALNGMRSRAQQQLYLDDALDENCQKQ